MRVHWSRSASGCLWSVLGLSGFGIGVRNAEACTRVRMYVCLEVARVHTSQGEKFRLAACHLGSRGHLDTS